MNKLLLSLLFSLCSIVAIAQIKFEPGYFIDNDGNKVECFIRNTDRSVNRPNFLYKLSEGASETKTATITDVQEFAIYDTEHRYQRFTVDMDRSSDKNKELSFNWEPEFEQELLFLRVLVEGKATLYSYTERNGLLRFFYKTDTIELQQLVYKKYTTNGTIVRENNAYKQQLWTTLPCATFSMDAFDKIKYEASALKKVFIMYNECAGASYTTYTRKRSKGDLSFTAMVGAHYTSFQLENMGNTNNIQKSDPKISPQAGLEVAYVLPFNKNQNAVYFAPSYVHYQNEQTVSLFGREGDLKINYSHIMLPIGIRRYFYLNDDSKLFFNGAFSYVLLLNRTKAIEVTNININSGIEHDSSLTNAFIVGGGYNHKNKYSIEASYHTNKVMLDNEYWRTRLVNSFSLTFGYRLK